MNKDTRDYKKLYEKMTWSCILMIFTGPDLTHPWQSGICFAAAMALMFSCSDLWTGYTG